MENNVAPINGETWVVDSSVDHKGRVPLRSKTGAWKAALFIIPVEFSERTSYFGLSTNLIIYLTTVLHLEVKTAAKSVNYWLGVTTMSPLLGGFMADSYLGRFNTVLLSSLLYILGLALLTISEYIQRTRSHDAFFLAIMYLISIATGGHKAALESFGADQFDGGSPEERRKKMSYFNWWNAGLCGGLVVGVTAVVYVQDNVGWGVAYVAMTVTMVAGLSAFYSGKPFYRYRSPAGSPLTPLVKVFVAAFRKRRLPYPSSSDELYEERGNMVGPRKRLLQHTASLRFLDKAAIVEHSNGGEAEVGNPWRLATVTQVEEAKLVVSAVPIWLTTQSFGLCLAQASTFFIKQGSIMDRRLTATFEIPPASIYTLSAVGMIVSVTIYDRLVVPFLRRATGNERGIGILRRIGFGMVFSSLALVVAAAVERRRRGGVAAVDGGDGEKAMSVFWLAPQFVILGIGDGFTLVGLQEYFYEKVPEGMRSIGIGFYLSVIGVSNFLSSLLIVVVDRATERASGRSWFANELDDSRLDYYYLLVAAINGVNLFVYVFAVARK